MKRLEDTYCDKVITGITLLRVPLSLSIIFIISWVLNTQLLRCVFKDFFACL